MQISKIFLKNFRSFGNSGETVSFDKISGFIGENSSGKTALIHSLVKLFGITAHERTLEKSDFHIQKQSTGEAHKELSLLIEARIDFPELNESVSNPLGQISIPPFFNHLVVRNPGEEPYLRVRLCGKWTADNTPEGEIDQKLFFVTVADGVDETEEDLVPVTPHQRSTIQVLYVPAVREPSGQLKNASGTILWRILNNITWPEDINDSIKTKMEPVNELFDGINGVSQIRNVIREEWKKYHKDARYQDAKIKFSSSTLASILKRSKFHFHLPMI